MTTTYGTLSGPVGFPAGLTVHRRAGRTTSVQGHVVRRRFQSSVARNDDNKPQIRRYPVTFGPISSSERDTILTAFDDAMGAALPIDFQPPGEAQTIPMRFVHDTLIIRAVSATAYQIDCELEEAI